MTIEIVINGATVYAGHSPAWAKKAIADQVAAEQARASMQALQPLFDVPKEQRECQEALL